MKKMFIGVAAVAMLLSCSKIAPTGTDGYYFEKETWIHTQFETNIVLVKTEDELTMLSEEHGKVNPPGREIFAFSVIDLPSGKCTIYMIDPKVSYKPEEYGHELTHCVYGEWHKVQP